MRVTRQMVIQLAIFSLLAAVALGIMVFGYMRVPAMMGIGVYKVTLELPETGGLYQRSNVTYRGSQVGIVDSVDLTDSGVQAVMSLNSNVKIPADLIASVRSQSAVGEQFVELVPQSSSGPELRNGDVISRDRARVPPDVNAVLELTNNGLRAIPQENLRTVIDESYLAVGGLGPELRRLVNGSSQLAIDARANLDSLTTVIDQVQPVLDSQTDSSDSIQAWAANLANITGQLQSEDGSVSGLLSTGPGAAEEVRALFDQLQPTLPVVLANLASVGEVAVTYQPNLEQLLVLLPQGTAVTQAVGVAKNGTKQDYMGDNLTLNLNLNIPPPCNTGFLPLQQQRTPTFQDTPARPARDVYSRLPQGGARSAPGPRNTPCVTVPGKRAPTAKMCESNENYVPLNDGFNWKGDPNGTLSGQAVPQLPPGSPPAEAPPPPGPAPPPMAAAEYDPANGTYVGPDGRVYTQSNLARSATEEQTWQTMLLPPTGN